MQKIFEKWKVWAEMKVPGGLAGLSQQKLSYLLGTTVVAPLAQP